MYRSGIETENRSRLTEEGIARSQGKGSYPIESGHRNRYLPYLLRDVPNTASALDRFARVQLWRK